VGPVRRVGRVVGRRALFGVLSGVAPGGVTLLSAPAGSGKTVLLRSWVEHAGLGDRVAWVSVERGEQDEQRFWLSVVREVRSAVGAGALVEQLVPTPRFDGRAVVARLVMELEALAEPIVLVVDDLHELVSSEALAQLGVLLERRPPLLRVVLATRQDPALGLHRLRLAGELTELRDADLRFTREEAGALLGAEGITLPAGSLAVLHQRTEGWAAGLRLAALSLARHPEPERFVAEFSGSERTVAEYLLAEVLARQPAEVRRLLLRTSVVDRVDGALANRLVGGSGSEWILQALEEANAFVVALDAGRTRFRYHHLFADLLRLELRRTDPDAVPELHRAAAGWYAEHGEIVEAVRHALAAGEWRQAGGLLNDHYLSLLLNGQGGTVAAYLAAFPAEASADPELATVLAADQMIHGSLDEAAAYVVLAERNAPAVADDRRHAFELKLAAVRLGIARRRGDYASVLEQVQPLLALAGRLPPGELAVDNDARAVALMNLGMIELWARQPEDAVPHLEQGLALARRIGRPYVQIGCLAHLAAAALRRSFAAARERAAEAVAIAEAHGVASDPIVGVALACLGAMDLWQGRFAEAERWLGRAEAALRAELEPAAELALHHLLGTLHLGLGRLGPALAAFRAAERLHAVLVGTLTRVVPVRQRLAQTLVQLGDTAAARATLAEAPAAERDRGELRMAFASLHLAEGEPRAAVDALGPVLDGTAPVLHDFAVAEALLLDAIARDRLGDARSAELDVERALELTEPNGLVLPFLLAPVRDLLARHPRHRTAHAAFLSDVLDVLGGSAPSGRDAGAPALGEELSEGELRVLRFLPSNLSGPEIGAELYLSANTVKTHMRHIYAKLAVHRRTEAVQRARALGLLGPSPRRG
jgi:LuxR family maltose regulon positive regulatory protein